MNKTVQFSTQVPQPVPMPVAHVQKLFSTVLFLGRTLSYVKVKFKGELDRRALIDTGAFAKLIRLDFYKKLFNTNIY